MITTFSSVPGCSVSAVFRACSVFAISASLSSTLLSKSQLCCRLSSKKHWTHKFLLQAKQRSFFTWYSLACWCAQRKHRVLSQSRHREVATPRLQSSWQTWHFFSWTGAVQESAGAAVLRWLSASRKRIASCWRQPELNEYVMLCYIMELLTAECATPLKTINQSINFISDNEIYRTVIKTRKPSWRCQTHAT